MKIFCVANQKGGIGKTTTATALASILAKKNKVLLIDADPQGNSSDTYRAKIKDQATLFDVILDSDPIPLKDAIQTTEIGDIVASDPLLKEADRRFPKDGNEYFILDDAIKGLKGYDYVVIDTAPADNLLLKNCLNASNYVIIPVTPDRYGIQGLADLNQTISAQKQRNNPNLKIAGLLLVKYKANTNLAKGVKEALEGVAKDMKTKVFNTTIRESVKAQNAQAFRTTLINYAPKSTTAQDYLQFVDELLKSLK